MTGSLFTSEVMQSAAQEMTQEEVQEIAKTDDPAGDQVCIMPCYSVSCCANVNPPTLRRSLCMTGVVVSRIKMIQLSTSPQNKAMSYSRQLLMGGALGKPHAYSSEFNRSTHVHVYSVPCRVSHFAEMYAKKLGIKAAVLNKTLWGDFYLNTKTKRIFKGAQVSTLHFSLD